MCGYETYLFGAAYPDAQCVEGYFWDIDSIEDGYFTSGGDIPCCSCNTAEYLNHVLEDCQSRLPSPGQRSPAEIWERTIAACLELAPQATAEHLRNHPPVFIPDWPGRVYQEAPKDPDDPDFVVLTWPWPIKSLTRHQQIALTPRARS